MRIEILCLFKDVWTDGSVNDASLLRTMSGWPIAAIAAISPYIFDKIQNTFEVESSRFQIFLQGSPRRATRR